MTGSWVGSTVVWPGFNMELVKTICPLVFLATGGDEDDEWGDVIKFCDLIAGGATDDAGQLLVTMAIFEGDRQTGLLTELV